MTESQEPPNSHQPVVGVAGPPDLVTRITELGAGLAGEDQADWRLVGITYHDEREVARELAKVESGLDSCLFTGPLPYDLARAAGELAVPATYIPLSSSALYGALARAGLEQRADVRHLSIDSIPRSEIDEAYAYLHMPVTDVQVIEYRDPDSPAEFFEFHRDAHRSQVAELALTSVRSVAQRLADADVPVLLMRPTTATIRSALRTAALLGIGSRLEDSQIAIGIVELPPTGQYSRDQLRLAVHHILLDEAWRMDATVLARDERSYYLVTTFGSLTAATEDLSAPPFIERIRQEVGLDVKFGIGLGVTARAAEANARTALAKADSAGERSYVVGADGTVLTSPMRPNTRQRSENPAHRKARTTLDRLAKALGSDPGSPADRLVVDAGVVAELLDITPRAARRVLHTLTETGLAWQLPPLRSPGPGRPKQLYRLLPEKLG
ncbi:hypothetical protein [Amycolatopsis taiwanensis]|uniref:Transcriptional regulator n=1 Tax=Amycolatopsis taiwanensis TaxID=342230 RepID=A0A9W6R768_9PSEU|nr:hypothetical protein [Amycolatopsis taiwanensis]GLY70334.1 hypothetical protein Atai01_69530 [Amycolatopsis taiwanensis]